MQELDLEQLREEEEQRENYNTASNKSGLDWVDAWLPTDEQETKLAERTNVKIQAGKVNNHRQMLQHELQRIRRGLKLKDRKTLVMEHIQLIRSRQKKNKTIIPKKSLQPLSEEDAFCVDEYESDNEHTFGRIMCCSKHTNPSFTDTEEGDEDDEDNQGNKRQQKRRNITASLASTADAISLLNGGLLDGSSLLPSSSNAFGNVHPGSGVRKIIYAARTHSQLSQFVREIRRAVSSSNYTSPAPKVVSLGGRSLLCGNEAILGKAKLGTSDINEAWITEQCLDLKKGTNSAASIPQGIVQINNNNQMKLRTTVGKRKKTPTLTSNKGNTSSTSTVGCPLFRHQEEAVATLGLHFLAMPSDIEDEALLGKSSHTCAYYATGVSITAADVVAVPYTTLLSKENREAVGLALKNACVIIDEAHNIPEALRSLKNCTLNLPTILAGRNSRRRVVEATRRGKI
jgi:hypothetical protein